MVEKHAVHGFSYLFFATEWKREIRHTSADLTAT